MADKACFKCGQVKALEQFYRHVGMRDGRLNKCVECTKRDVRAHRLANLERIRQYDRGRSPLPHRAALRNRVGSAWASKHPDRYRAQKTLQRAVREGILARPRNCERCGHVAGRIEGHHEDYRKPLDVQWLCKPCHAAADKMRRQVEGVC